MAQAAKKSDLLFESSNWDFDTLDRTYNAIEDIAPDMSP